VLDMETDQRRASGATGERIAAEHLEQRGYEIVARNFRTRYGELDLIAADGQALVFCEVKTRVAGTRAGPDGPFDAIGARKRDKLRRMAAQWLAATPPGARPWTRDIRFDAIGVILSPGGCLLALEHLENAF
jgi:putative endonuclease